MNILVLNGSPKEKSDTMRMTKSFVEGILSEKECTVTFVDVIKKNIRPCVGCFRCWQNGDGKCVISDDQNEILSLYQKADVIVWSFPLYCYSMPSHLKAVLDRTIPLLKLSMKEIDGRVQHDTLIDFSKKRIVVLCGAGFPDWEGNFEGLRLQIKHCFSNLTSVFVPEAPLMNIPSAAPLADMLLQKFFMAGKEYAKAETLSFKTVQALETPMIPKDVYLRSVNS